jgi:asparagine synthase (glutamine-hydrolysing)
MCGIAGIVSFTHRILEAEIEPMIEAQRHRGPDDCGSWSDDRCVLGHTRLAIIDLSEAGRQPLCNEDGSVWITFNGEIYNFQRLREELEQRGHCFRTRTDTEAIVHAYEEWGPDCVQRLRGMFAFAIWDTRHRRLFLARDRAGKKPLFYSENGERFLFASELQGLLAGPDVPREVDLRAIDAYLSWGYVPPPRTGFKHVSKLLPGHWLTLDLTPEGPVVRTERYWRLEYTPKLPLREEDAVATLREKFSEAVRLRMISDVPVGAFLSGGIDSGIVVGLMAQVSSRPVKTFSIGFEEARFNELDHARLVAERWKTEHHELIVRPDAGAILPALVRHYGEPYADSSAIPTYYVSQMTRKSATVALNGDGGDELFAGYKRYFANTLAERICRIPGSAQAAAFLSWALPDTADPRSRRRWAARFLAAAHQPMPERVGSWVGQFNEGEKRQLYSGDLRALLDGERPEAWMEELFTETAGLHPAEAAMSVDIRSYLPYDLLVKVDIASMIHGLEARSPFLDHEVMAFAARLPARMKLRRGRTKFLLRRAFADLIPPQNQNLPKMGFCVPVGEWLRGELRELLCDCLLSPRSLARGYFQPRALQELATSHVNGRVDHEGRLWALVMLELWHREMVEASARVDRSSGRVRLGSTRSIR